MLCCHDSKAAPQIAADRVTVCGTSVDACVDTLATNDHGWRERKFDYLLRPGKTLARRAIRQRMGRLAALLMSPLG